MYLQYANYINKVLTSPLETTFPNLGISGLLFFFVFILD